MENWTLLKNDLMEYFDNGAMEMTERKNNIKNTLKTTIKKPISYNLNSEEVYKKISVIDIPRQYDNLSQVLVKITLSNGGVDDSGEPGTAARIFKKIVLRTKSGIVLQELTSHYLLKRYDELLNTPLYSWVSLGMELQGSLLSDQTLMLPLFFFFSESDNTMLRTRLYGPLEIVFETNENKKLMGFTNDITSITYEAYFTYFDTDESSNKSDLPLVKKTVSKDIYGTYNIFYEDVQNIGNGTTSKRFLLRCPNPIFAIHMALFDSDGNYSQITNFKIESGSSEIVNVDYKGNYTLMNMNNNGRGGTGILTHWFNKKQSRTSTSGLISFSGSMYPIYLTVEFTASLNTRSLVVYSEHKTAYNVSETGRIYFGLPSNMEQNNSLLSATF